MSWIEEKKAISRDRQTTLDQIDRLQRNLDEAIASLQQHFENLGNLQGQLNRMATVVAQSGETIALRRRRLSIEEQVIALSSMLSESGLQQRIARNADQLDALKQSAGLRGPKEIAAVA